MPETLTESFCERCGTRYTFEAAIPSGRRLGRLKVLTKGLTNFVMSDDMSFDEALADARSGQQREMTSHQLDAFHQTFQFCMSCRQYTCANCWNEPEGRCLSCAPLPDQEILEAPSPHLEPAADLAQIDASATDGAAIGHAQRPTVDASAWPTADLPATRKPEAKEVAAQPPAAVAEEEPAVDVQAAVAEVALDETAAEPPPVSLAPVAAVEEIDEDVTQAIADAERHRAAAAGAAEVDAAAAASSAAFRTPETPALPTAPATGKATGLLARFRPVRRAPARVDGPGIVASVQQPLEPAAVEPAAVEPAAVEPAAVEPAAVEPAAAPRRDRIETPTWRIVAPDVTEPSTPSPDLVSPPPAVPTHTDTPPPRWPMPAATVAPQWPSRPAAPPPADLWAASSQDVLNRPGSGVQACVSCGLPLSATARFCRRCGSQQH